MKTSIKSNSTESHKFLPSGEWEGFYCYNNSPTQHKMSLKIYFSNKKVSGHGTDDINTFTWSGNYDLNTFKINIHKVYPTHRFIYSGDIDENGIWGIWKNNEDKSNLNLNPKILAILENAFKDKMQGGFHIWPKKKDTFSQEMEAETELEKSLKLEEIYIEHFI